MIIQTSDFKVIQEIDTIPKTSHLMFSPKGSILATWEPYTGMCSIYRSTSLSQSPREWRKYFELSEVRHIKQNVSSPKYDVPVQYLQDLLRDQARGRLGRNSRPRGRNFALNGTQREVGVSLKKKNFFFFFFLGRLIFILSPHKCKLW